MSHSKPGRLPNRDVGIRARGPRSTTDQLELAASVNIPGANIVRNKKQFMPCTLRIIWSSSDAIAAANVFGRKGGRQDTPKNSLTNKEMV